MEIIYGTLNLPEVPTPVFSTARDWILKLGLFNLGQSCEDGEWGWIIDCSIQMGSMKILLILGFRLEFLQERDNFILSHSDVKPIVLKTIDSCPGEVVQLALNEAKLKTGDPVVIISDEGSDLKRGIRLYKEEQKISKRSVIHLHDILHKADLVLKKEVKQDPHWEDFTKKMNLSLQQLKLSSSAHLIPPKKRQKNRIRGEINVIDCGIKKISIA